MLIDFHVLQSKNYSFFIEDELCEIKLRRQEDGYSYGFEINREVDTPKNRERRATEKRHLRKGLLLLLALSLFVTLVWMGLRYRHHSRLTAEQTALLDEEAKESVAKLFPGSGASGAGIRYSFVADGRIVEGKIRYTDAVLPIEAGDEFIVRYAPHRPAAHEIAFDRPTDRQLDRYRRRAHAQHQRLHPELSAERIDCVLDVLFDAGGTDAYADVYFQDRSQAENPLHNRDSYRDRITQPAVAAALSRRCR